jgi:hypothetical protein
LTAHLQLITALICPKYPPDISLLQILTDKRCAHVLLLYLPLSSAPCVPDLCAAGREFKRWAWLGSSGRAEGRARRHQTDKCCAQN